MRTSLRLLALSLPVAAPFAAASPAPATGWTIQPSLAARVGYDSNLFLQDPAPAPPSSEPARAGYWFVRATASIEASCRLSDAFQFDLAYTPETVRYADFSSEDHFDQRVDFGATVRNGPWSGQFKANLALVDGADDESPVYRQAGGGPAIGGVGVRSRRDQLNTRLSGNVARSLGSGFVRAAGDACFNDYGTRQFNAATHPGYANYVDRSEYAAGLDLGREIAPHVSTFVGVRGGEQIQANLVGKTTNYSNHLVRLLVGLEGKPAEHLTVRIVAGPDFRHYDETVDAGFDATRTARYAEASVTWTATTQDTLVVCAKDWLWLSAGGPCAYQDTDVAIQWRHSFNARWSTSLMADVHAGDSRDFSSGPGRRLDWIYTATTGVGYALDPHTKLDLEYIHEWSDSAFPGTPGREYTRDQVSVGVKRSF